MIISFRRVVPTVTAIASAFALVMAAAPTYSADWRTDVGTFKVGLVASSAPRGQGLAALQRSFSAALGMPVDFFVARDFAMLIDAQASSRIEYAVFSTAAYATAAELCDCVEPIAAPVDVDGAFGVKSVVIARKDMVGALADLARAKLVVPPADSVPGWQAPLSLLGKDGLTIKGDEAFIVKARSAVDAEALFMRGDAGAIVGWERSTAQDKGLAQGGTLDRLRRGGVDLASVKVIWRSPVIPYGPHAVLKSLNGEAKRILAKYLLDLHANDPQAYDLLSGGHAGGFAPIDDEAYAVMRQIVRDTAERVDP